MPVAATKRDYYEVLGVSRTADAEEIKRVYRRLAMKYHPDRNEGAGKAEAEARFKECASAYEVLSDPEKRQRYDQFGHDGVSGRHDFQGMDPNDIASMFNEIFGGMGGGGGRQGGGGGRPRGYDLETQVELTLAEVATGVEKTIEFERQDYCETCKGSGARPGTAPVACVQCGGRGQVTQQGFGGMFRMVTTCPNCRGRGTIVRDHCGGCGGTGRRARKRTLTVKIPAGVSEGQAVRIAGEGEPADAAGGGARGGNGDLHCHIAIRPHPIFTRHQNDLVCQVPIGFSQAALGARVEVPTLRGKQELEIPPGTQHGEVFKLRGMGLPDLRSGRPGDEVVQVMIEVPRRLNERQRQLLRDYALTEEAANMPHRKGFLDKIKDALTGETK